jgi:peptidoglycan-associated lipoprotein
MVVLCIFLLSMAGCAKKAVTKDEGLTVAEQKAPAQASAAVQPSAPPAVGDVREQALRQDAAAAAEAKPVTKSEFADIRFAFDKSTIEPEAREMLKKLADWLLMNKSSSLAIEGHCDERGTVEYNLALGEKRAMEAAKYLVDLGIEKDRVKTISYGKEMPLDKGSNEEAWAKNRRARFVIFPPVK